MRREERGERRGERAEEERGRDHGNTKVVLRNNDVITSLSDSGPRLSHPPPARRMVACGLSHVRFERWCTVRDTTVDQGFEAFGDSRAAACGGLRALGV